MSIKSWGGGGSNTWPRGYMQLLYIFVSDNNLTPHIKTSDYDIPILPLEMQRTLILFTLHFKWVWQYSNKVVQQLETSALKKMETGSW